MSLLGASIGAALPAPRFDVTCRASRHCSAMVRLLLTALLRFTEPSREKGDVYQLPVGGIMSSRTCSRGGVAGRDIDVPVDADGEMGTPRCA